MFNIHACRNHVVIIQASTLHNIPQESSIKTIYVLQKHAKYITAEDMFDYATAGVLRQ